MKTMYKYKVTLNGFKLNVIEAESYDKAFQKAVYLYGLEIDIEKL